MYDILEKEGIVGGDNDPPIHNNKIILDASAFAFRVVLEKYDAAKKTVSCINSHGQRDQHPIVSTSDILHLYRVNCIAEDAEKKCSLSPTVAANTKGNAKSSGVYAKKNKISQSASAQPQPSLGMCSC